MDIQQIKIVAPLRVDKLQEQRKGLRRLASAKVQARTAKCSSKKPCGSEFCDRCGFRWNKDDGLAARAADYEPNRTYAVTIHLDMIGLNVDSARKALRRNRTTLKERLNELNARYLALFEVEWRRIFRMSRGRLRDERWRNRFAKDDLVGDLHVHFLIETNLSEEELLRRLTERRKRQPVWSGPTQVRIRRAYDPAGWIGYSGKRHYPSTKDMSLEEARRLVEVMEYLTPRKCQIKGAPKYQRPVPEAVAKLTEKMRGKSMVNKVTHLLQCPVEDDPMWFYLDPSAGIALSQPRDDAELPICTVSESTAP